MVAWRHGQTLAGAVIRLRARAISLQLPWPGTHQFFQHKALLHVHAQDRERDRQDEAVLAIVANAHQATLARAQEAPGGRGMRTGWHGHAYAPAHESL